MVKRNLWKNSTKTTYKQSKYHNEKVIFDGIKFDSKKEFNRYMELKLLEKAGKISYLELQKPFVLIDKSKYGRQIVYKADFVYYDNELNKLIVEDVKGVKTDVYKLKKRLIAEKYDIEIIET